MNNDNMNLNDIFTTMSDVSNSLWNLRKRGGLTVMSDDEFTRVYKTAAKMYSELGWALMYQNKLDRAS